MSSRRKKRDNGMGGRFVGLPHWVMLHPAYRAASARARSLLFDVAMQYNGRNNGRLVACEKFLNPLGWKSKDGIHKGKTELLSLGLLVETRKGAKPNRAAWYALSWRPLDATAGLDLDPRHYVTLAARKIDVRPPPSGVDGQIIGPLYGVSVSPPTPPDGPMRGVFRPSSTPPAGAYIDVTIPIANAQGDAR